MSDCAGFMVVLDVSLYVEGGVHGDIPAGQLAVTAGSGYSGHTSIRLRGAQTSIGTHHTHFI